jgi:Tfp pilus assembly protein PilN
MPFRFPVRRFLQSTEKNQAPSNRYGSLQWVLARPLYRFHVIDLSQVPLKNRPQALKLELSQWTPFSHPAYYVGWNGAQALIWAWDSEKVGSAIAAQGLKISSVEILPESLLQVPLHSGPCLARCLEGFEGQLWRSAKLQNSRWWPQTPSAQEWLMFQRDAGVPPDEQMAQPPSARGGVLADRPWLHAVGQADTTLMIEQTAYAALALVLLVPTLWFGAQWYKMQDAVAQLNTQKQQMQNEASPIAQARSQALDSLVRINSLSKLNPYPEQLALIAKLAQILPQDKSVLKDWDFQNGQLKLTITSAVDVSTTNIINLLQQAGAFKDVKALPGRDAKSVTFQMDVIPNGATSVGSAS